MATAKTTPIGGPAFPTRRENLTALHGQQGMTMLDYFAAAALPGIVASVIDDDLPLEYQFDHAASFAYRVAKAMLKRKAEITSEGT